MPSKILFNKQTNEIIRSQTEPKGSAGLPSFKALCKSARIPEAKKYNLDTVIIENEYLTNQAKKELRIVNGKAIVKPTVDIILNKYKLIAGQALILNVDIKNTVKSDNFLEVSLNINGIKFKVDIENNQGSKKIELQEPDEYILSCDDHRFISQPVIAEVV